MEIDLLRLVSDLAHLASFIWLWYSLKKHQQCSGLSYKTQEILLVTFILRYSDLFLRTNTLRDTLFKVLFLFFTLYCIFLMRRKTPIKETYDAALDGMPHRYTVYPIAALVGYLLSLNGELSPFGHLFPIFYTTYNVTLVLEALAFLPQVWLFAKTKQRNPGLQIYILLLVFYKMGYLLAWMRDSQKSYAVVQDVYTRMIVAAVQITIQLICLVVRPKHTEELDEPFERSHAPLPAVHVLG